MKRLIKTVLIVGLGSIGKRYVKIIRRIFPEVNVVVLRHKQCDDGGIESLGFHKCVTSLDEALKLNLQAAIISNPASKHLWVAKKLAENGVSLLIEKPISNSSNGVQELIDVCRLNKVILMTGYNLRFLPSLTEFRRQINSGKIGKVYSVRSEAGQYLPNWRPGLDYRCSVSAQKRLGGGVLLELSHEIDYLSWIFGEVEWVKSCVLRQSDLEINVEDSAHMILGFEKVDNTALTALLSIDFIRHDTTRRCFAIGEEGTLLWDGVTGEVKFFSKLDPRWKVLFSVNPGRDFTYTEEVKSFFASVESNSDPSISGEEGLRAVSIVENIKESSDKDSVVFCQK